MQRKSVPLSTAQSWSQSLTRPCHLEQMPRDLSQPMPVAPHSAEPPVSTRALRLVPTAPTAQRRGPRPLGRSSLHRALGPDCPAAAGAPEGRSRPCPERVRTPA